MKLSEEEQCYNLILLCNQNDHDYKLHFIGRNITVLHTYVMFVMIYFILASILKLLEF